MIIRSRMFEPEKCITRLQAASIRKTHFFERHAHTGCAPSGVYGDFAQPAVCSVFSGTQSCAAAGAEVFCEAASGVLLGSSIAASAAEGAPCSAAHGVRV